MARATRVGVGLTSGKTGKIERLPKVAKRTRVLIVVGLISREKIRIQK